MRNYLLLTCFDLLGQPAPFKDFQTWLLAGSTEEERNAALAKVSDTCTTLEAVQIIHGEYLQTYGTRNAFSRFINMVLPDPARTELFFSIQIRRIDPVANRQIGVVESDDEKAKWLFSIRNSYTHKAVNTGSPVGGVFENAGGPILIDGKMRYGYAPIHWEEKAGVRHEYGVRRWPYVLKEAVEAGLGVVASQVLAPQ